MPVCCVRTAKMLLIGILPEKGLMPAQFQKPMPYAEGHALSRRRSRRQFLKRLG